MALKRSCCTMQVWNAQAEQKKISSGDGYMTSPDRAALVPQAANVLREQGHPEMAIILDNTTEGARKVRGQYASHVCFLWRYFDLPQADL